MRSARLKIGLFVFMSACSQREDSSPDSQHGGASDDSRATLLDDHVVTARGFSVEIPVLASDPRRRSRCAGRRDRPSTQRLGTRT